MKQITALFAILFILIIITSCGPHFNPHAKPDIYTEPAPAVAVDVPKPAPQDVTLKVPNWPMVAYSHAPEEAFILLLVKDPSKFPVPKDITFQHKDGSVIVMQMLQPSKK